ncbi:MAG: hypothetical protein VX733_02925 [Candidatus Latescibacterota bacterium]|nr:hypothetical protein [Candidatus Latescibacterota bacterium]
MLRGLIPLALALGFLGCSGEEEIEELKQYVSQIQAFHHYNQKMEDFIVQFDDPSRELVVGDILASRKLLDEYHAAVAAVALPSETALKNAHRLYVRSFDDSKRLARDETGDLRRQAHSVVIGLRRLRTVIADRFYPSIEVLLARKNLAGDTYNLFWPEHD